MSFGRDESPTEHNHFMRKFEHLGCRPDLPTPVPLQFKTSGVPIATMASQKHVTSSRDVALQQGGQQLPLVVHVHVRKPIAHVLREDYQCRKASHQHVQRHDSQVISSAVKVDGIFDALEAAFVVPNHVAVIVVAEVLGSTADRTGVFSAIPNRLVTQGTVFHRFDYSRLILDERARQGRRNGNGQPPPGSVQHLNEPRKIPAISVCDGDEWSVRMGRPHTSAPG
jgi:hypothetical protein